GEAYEFMARLLPPDVCFGLAGDPTAFGDSQAAAAAQPFEGFYQLPYDKVKIAPYTHELGQGFFAAQYGFDDADLDAWRRIDTDWLNLSEGLALALTGHVNNTSLVLAFELGEGGPVLLFPGDAQAGSWLSWSDLTWELKDGSRERTVTGADLLRRTVFY